MNGVPDLGLEEVWNVKEGVGRRVGAVVERGVRLYSTQYYHMVQGVQNIHLQ